MIPRLSLLARILAPAATLLLAGGLFPRDSSAQDRTAVVLSTASVGGETISCGCQKKELGGISRRAAFVKAERAEKPDALLVDAGDFGSHVDVEPWMRTEFQIEMMAKMGYDAVTPGPNEMMFGVEELRKLWARAPAIRVVSANVTDKSGTLLWDEFAVIEKGGVKFAVTGVTDKAFYDFSLSRGVQKIDEFAFLDPRAALLRVLPEMRKQADVTVVLLHTGSGDAKRLLAGLDGIDLAVAGHAPVYKFAPETVGGTVLVHAGSRGQYIGRTTFTLSGGRVAGHSGESLALGDTMTPDPEFDQIVKTFNKKYDALAEKAKPAGSKKPAEKNS